MQNPKGKQRNLEQAQGVAAFSQKTTNFQIHEGPVPHPDVVAGYESVLPGAADRILKLAESESMHRHARDRDAMDANIDAQKKQLGINEYQTKASFRSDIVGQALGFIVSFSCIAGAVVLALQDKNAAAVASALIPCAAIIRAFFVPKK